MRIILTTSLYYYISFLQVLKVILQQTMSCFISYLERVLFFLLKYCRCLIINGYNIFVRDQQQLNLVLHNCNTSILYMTIITTVEHDINRKPQLGRIWSQTIDSSESERSKPNIYIQLYTVYVVKTLVNDSQMRYHFNHRVIVSLINSLDASGNYAATSNNVIPTRIQYRCRL